MDQVQQHIAESSPVLEKEHGEDGDNDKQPGLPGHVGNAQAHMLRQLCDFIAMVGQERTDELGALVVPAVLLADLLCDLAGAELCQEAGNRLPESCPPIGPVSANDWAWPAN